MANDGWDFLGFFLYLNVRVRRNEKIHSKIYDNKCFLKIDKKYKNLILKNDNNCNLIKHNRRVCNNNSIATIGKKQQPGCV